MAPLPGVKAAVMTGTEAEADPLGVTFLLPPQAIGEPAVEGIAPVLPGAETAAPENPALIEEKDETVLPPPETTQLPGDEPPRDDGVDKLPTSQAPASEKTGAAKIVAPKPKQEPGPALRSEVIAVYTTSLKGSPVNRTHNIRLAAARISGLVLAPGEVFSFNRTVGPRTSQTGFKSAMIISNRKFVPGIGGGVCQVASTIYNVALKAKMKVVERYPHSLRVKYVPPGRDATVYYGRADFRFKNTKSFPVKILAEVTGKQLTISLLGAK